MSITLYRAWKRLAQCWARCERSIKVACNDFQSLLLSRQTQESRQPLCAFSTLDRGAGAPAAQLRRARGGSVNKAACLPAGPAQPLKGKASRDFPSRLLRNASGRDNRPDALGLASATPRVISDLGPVLEQELGRVGARAGASVSPDAE